LYLFARLDIHMSFATITKEREYDVVYVCAIERLVRVDLNFSIIVFDVRVVTLEHEYCML
jgi:hypothetical protein